MRIRLVAYRSTTMEYGTMKSQNPLPRVIRRKNQLLPAVRLYKTYGVMLFVKLTVTNVVENIETVAKALS